MTPTLMAVDGNSLLHRAFHADARTDFRLPGGEPAWAVRGLLGAIAAAASRTCADAVVVGFDDPDASVRRDRWPHYKAQRPPKPASLSTQLSLAVSVLRDLGLVVTVPPGLEADDVLASAAAFAPGIGARAVCVTSDRDAFALVDEHTRVLRIINGGVDASPMLDVERSTLLTGVAPSAYRDLAALRGDASDNLPGVHGVGPKRAAALLAEFGGAAAAFDAAQADDPRCVEVVGRSAAAALARPGARERWAENCAVMTMHTDVELGLDLAAGVGTLPVEPEAVRAAYARFDLGYAAALRALCGVDSPGPDPRDAQEGWAPPRPRRARHAPLRRPPAPAHVQERLF